MHPHLDAFETHRGDRYDNFRREALPAKCLTSDVDLPSPPRLALHRMPANHCCARTGMAAVLEAVTPALGPASVSTRSNHPRVSNLYSCLLRSAAISEFMEENPGKPLDGPAIFAMVETSSTPPPAWPYRRSLMGVQDAS